KNYDPASIIYVRLPEGNNKLDIRAQGVSMSSIIGDASITLSGNDDGEYVLSGKIKGFDGPIYSTSTPKTTEKVQHYILTSSNSDNGYKFWSAAAVDENSDEWYLGVKPTLELDGKYYAPYYASFPFETKSPGMKVYIVSSFTNNGYTLKEVTGVIPQATPVLIECSSDDPSKNRLTLHEPGTRGANVSDNKLKGIYYYNPDLSMTAYPGCVTEFDPSTMRVWNVRNGKLVLSTATDNLKYAQVSRYKFIHALNPNQSYLVVPEGTAEALGDGVTITFDTDGGTEVAPVFGVPGENIPSVAQPTKAGYTFVGWDKELSTFPDASMTVKALWKVNQYTITFDCNGGSAVNAITQDYGTSFTAPANPTRAGYTFAGWDREMPSAIPAGNITLVAQWTPNQYTITFDSDGGSAVKPITQDYASAVTAPAAPVREGYTFKGWQPELPATMPLDGMTVKAQWQINQYTIKFDSNGGTSVNAITQDYGTAVTAPANPTKDGYTFVGWSADIPTTMPAQDMTLTAQWRINNYTITFDTDGGSLIDDIIAAFGAAISKPSDPVRTGYTFKGWDNEWPSTMPLNGLILKALWEVNRYKVTFLMDDGETVLKQDEISYGLPVTAPTVPNKEGSKFIGWTPELDATMPAHDVVYTAVFSDNSYTVTFDTNGGTAIESITGVYGTPFTAPANPTREGYTFAGWDKEMPSAIPAGDVTLVAQWTPNKYTITFDSDGGSAISAITQDYATAITAPAAPVREGYSFKGWQPELPATMPLDGMAVKAQWQINQYTITFDCNDGSTVSAITQDYGTAVTAPAAPVREGYTFAGWDKEIPSTIPAGDMTIVAQWTANQYTITFDSDGGSAVSAITQDYGTAVTAPAAPVREGYTFKGWLPELPATMPLEGVTVKAQWQINQYTITFDCDGGSTVSAITQDYGTAVTVPAAPVKVGYIFAGWDKEIPTTMPANDIAIKAVWEIAYQDYAVALASGWNWVTFPMMDADMDNVSNLFAEGSWSAGDEIKTKTDVAAYTAKLGKWVGTLTRQGNLSNTGMYKMRSSAAQTVTVKRNARVMIPSEVNMTVNPGWNYISYLPAEGMTLSEALANYQASEGDVIKSQDASSQYSESQGWVGQLTELLPGHGYMLKRTSNRSVSFRYADAAENKLQPAAVNSKSYRYADNMTVVACVDDIATQEGDTLVATVDGEVRGSAALSADGLLLLTIQGDNAAPVTLSLLRDGEVYATANAALCYEKDAVVGSLAAPTSISFVEESDGDASVIAGNVVAIYTADGKKLNTVNVNSLAAGTYIIYTETDSKTSVFKITKK
ncbi:MAG: InlB B-repeat-containing protein, partial [Prevotellaceae bacterium]|nr:InlB B-repeat-containing protein [Prevotellaceae bacterium]